MRFGEYDNADQHFYGKRDAHTFGRHLEATKDLVLLLNALPSVSQDGFRHDVGTALVFAVHPAKVLAFTKGRFSHTRHRF